MKRTAVAAIVIAALGAIALPVLAETNHGHGNENKIPGADVADPELPGMMGQNAQGHGMMEGGMGSMMHMMKMMHDQHSGMMGGGMMGGGMMGGGMMGGGMMGDADHLQRLLDVDGDGSVSPDEFRQGMLTELGKYDADGNGSLSLAEFETMHAAHVKEMTVDRFQAFDADGDGQVTADEIAAPADRMERMTRMQAGSGTGTMPMSGEQGSGQMMKGN